MEQLTSNYILSRDGLKLNALVSSVETPLALVCIFHGHGEHAGRYEHVMKFFNEKNIASVAFDFRGHGQSGGQRGHMPSMERILSDMEESLKFARSQYLEVPMFIFGHSFGGCAVLNYVLKKPVLELTGFIASSPWLRLAFEPPVWKLKLGKVMANLIPRLSLPSELDANNLSRDQEVVKAYTEDPLVHDRISARFFSETGKAGKYALDHADELKINGLVYHGTADEIIDFSATQDFAKKAGKKIEFHPLDGFFHEPHNDIGKEEVLGLLAEWISLTTKKRS